MCLLPSHFAKRHYHDCGWGIGFIGQLLRDVILIMVRGRGYVGRLQNLNKAKVKVLILVSKLTLSSASLQSLSSEFASIAAILKQPCQQKLRRNNFDRQDFLLLLWKSSLKKSNRRIIVGD